MVTSSANPISARPQLLLWVWDTPTTKRSVISLVEGDVIWKSCMMLAGITNLHTLAPNPDLCLNFYRPFIQGNLYQTKIQYGVVSKSKQ